MKPDFAAAAAALKAENVRIILHNYKLYFVAIFDEKMSFYKASFIPLRYGGLIRRDASDLGSYFFCRLTVLWPL